MATQYTARGRLPLATRTPEKIATFYGKVYGEVARQPTRGRPPVQARENMHGQSDPIRSPPPFLPPSPL